MQTTRQFSLPFVLFFLCMAGCGGGPPVLRFPKGIVPGVALKICITQSSQAAIADSLVKYLSASLQSEANRFGKFMTTSDTGKADLLFDLTIADYALVTPEMQKKFFKVRERVYKETDRVNDSIAREFGDPAFKITAMNIIANAVTLPFGVVTVVTEVEPPFRKVPPAHEKILKSKRYSANLTVYAKIKSQRRSVLWEQTFDQRFGIYKPLSDELQLLNLARSAIYTLEQNVPIYKSANGGRKQRR
jgi:hypothetical protein